MHDSIEQQHDQNGSKSQKLIDAVQNAAQPLPPVEAPAGEETFFVPELVDIARAHEFLSSLDAAKAKELFAKKSDVHELLDDDASLRLAKQVNAVRGLYTAGVVRNVLRAFQSKDLPIVFGVLATHWNAAFAKALTQYDEVSKLRDVLVPLAVADHIERGVGVEEMDACLRALGVVKESSGPTPKDRVARVAGEWVVEQTRVLDVDEQDFKLTSYLQVRLPDTANEAVCTAFDAAVKKRDVQGFLRSIRAAYRGELTDAVLEAAEDDYADVLRWRTAAEQRLKQLSATLPDEAGALHVYNARFDRTRKIAPFTDILLGKLSKNLFAFVLADLRSVEQGVRPVKTVWERADALLDEAVRMYHMVHERGVPVFREFAQYLAEHAKDGEFHVGRDTKTTTYIASHAERWGTMSGEERHALIRHVNISRPLLNSAPRVLLKQFLRQEGVNERMIGIDGGYMGTNPQRAVMAMNPEVTFDALNAQIKLISADAKLRMRQFDPEANYYQFVEWMETLPKFTDRMQHLETKEVQGVVKFLGSTKSRAPAEQLLAWVVQHAVWRGTIPKKLIEPDERVGADAPVRQRSFAEVMRDLEFVKK